MENPQLLGEADDKFFDWDGLVIHYKITEKPSTDALTLVLMHGFSGCMENFANIWNDLARDHQLVAFDRPPWGLSSRVVRRPDGTWPTLSGQNPYTYEYSRQLLRGVLEHLNLLNGQYTLVLVGHSHGGTTAASILCHDDELRTKVFKGAILIDGPLKAWPVPRFAGKMAEKSPNFSRHFVNGTAGLFRWGAQFKWGCGHPFYDFKAFLKRFPDAAVGWDSLFRVTGWRPAFVEWCLANAKRAEMDLTKLQEITVLDIRGKQDNVIRPDDGQKCAAETRAQIVLVDKARHLPFADQPEVFLQHVADFLEGIRITYTYKA